MNDHTRVLKRIGLVVVFLWFLIGGVAHFALTPAQAIIRDKDTWLNGSAGFEIQSLRAGG
jgi:hypothetical protein